MLSLKKLIPTLFCMLLAPVSFANTSATLVFEKPANQQEAAILESLQKSDVPTEVVSLINEKFKLPKTLKIIFGSEDGPLYQPETNEIFVPYTFIDEVNKRFVAAKYADSGVTPAEATDDALMHTLFHEFGHALVNLFDLPITAKEEDAVDSLASVLLIEFYEHGRETVISAADLFNLESPEVATLEEADFWDEHSLDAQRYYSALCHVYGSDPEKYASILEDTDISDDRAELCIEEYESLTKNWFKLLKLPR